MGVRVNESWDHHELYTRTNEMAKKADPSRQTGGVRYMENSDFLEDVYTMNDFIYDGGDKDKLSRLIHVKTYDETHGNDAITVLRDPKQVARKCLRLLIWSQNMPVICFLRNDLIKKSV